MARGDTLRAGAPPRFGRARRAPSRRFVFGDSARRGDSVAVPRRSCRRCCGRSWSARSAPDIRSSSSPTASSTIPTRLARCRPARAIVVLRAPPRRDLAAVDDRRAARGGRAATPSRCASASSPAAAARRPGTLALTLDGKPIATSPVDSLPPSASGPWRSARGSRARRAGACCARSSRRPSDAEPRNDTLSVGVDLSRAASAVFVSTSPDFDARYALAVLRGALGIPTRGFFRVAPGEWRVEGALTPRHRGRSAAGGARRAGRDHPRRHGGVRPAARGDARAAGAHRDDRRREGEWYASAAPASPLAPALSGFVVGQPAAASRVAATQPEGHVGRARGAARPRDERKPIVVGTDEPRRVAIVARVGPLALALPRRRRVRRVHGALGEHLRLAGRRARRSARGGARRASAARGRSGAVAPRCGDGPRGRRSSLRQRGATRVDSLTLRFGAGATVVETRAACAGDLRGGDARRHGAARRERVARMAAARAAASRTARCAARSRPTRCRCCAMLGWAYALAILHAVRRVDSAAAPGMR